MQGGGHKQSNIWGLMLGKKCQDAKAIALRRRNTILIRSSKQLICLVLEPLKGFSSWRGILEGSLNLALYVFLELHRYNNSVRYDVHKSIKGPSSLTWFTITIENSNTSKYSTAVAKKERGKRKQ